MIQRVAARAVVTVALLIAAATGAGQLQAQPVLDDLWPNDNGLLWTYLYSDVSTVDPSESGIATLLLEGVVMTAGGQAQILTGQMDVSPAKVAAASGYGGALGAVWRARPDLRAAIAARYGAPKTVDSWAPYFLHDGYFMKTPSAIQMWQPSWNHPTWTYLTSDLTVGAAFTHQLLPELVSDIFLHGTVGALDAAVATPVGDFTGAVRMDYVIDLGTRVHTNESGELVGYSHGEYRGHVYFVPAVGPVEMLEDYTPYVSVDCSPDPCPAEWTSQLGVVQSSKALALSALPLAEQGVSWSAVKAMFR